MIIFGEADRLKVERGRKMGIKDSENVDKRRGNLPRENQFTRDCEVIDTEGEYAF
jgi:hypothetical protein